MDMRHVAVAALIAAVVLGLYAVAHEADSDGQRDRAGHITDDYTGSP